MGDFSFEKYVSLEDYNGNWTFFDKETRIDNRDSIYLKPLTKEYSSFLWSKYVSKRNGRLMLMDDSEWSCNLEKQNYNWQENWNQGNYNGLRDYLKNVVTFVESDIIYFFWMKEDCIETTWNIFLKYWINFLYNDEGPLIISLNNDYAISFGPQGSLFIGKRKLLENIK